MSPNDTSLRTIEVIRLVASREVRERLRAKSFYILTALLIVLILAGGVIARIAGDDGPGRIDVGIVGADAEALSEAVIHTSTAFEREASIETFADDGPARDALEDGDLDVVIVPADGEALFAEEVDNEALALLRQAWSSGEVRGALTEAGLSASEIDDALATPPLEATTLDGDENDDGLAILTGTAAAILLFISLQTFGGYVLTGVVEEKSTAVVELLLVRARSDHMLAGKVIGIGVAAMLQFALAVLAALAAMLISGAEIPGEIWSAVPMTLVWFLGGYAFYSTLFALAGSLVSRQEDAQAASAPIMSVLIIAYMLVFFFGYVPDSTASTVMSLIPPLAPLLMPMRMAAGAASIVEIIASLGLLALSIVAAWKLAGRIYEQVLLQRGSRISWRTAASFVRRG